MLIANLKWKRALAIAWLSAFVALAPAPAQKPAGSAEERFQLGTEAMKQGQLADAEKYFSEAVAARPEFAEARFNLGLVHEQQGKMEDAIRDLRAALKIRPGMRGANLFLGIACYKLNNLAQAREALRLEVKSNPNDPKALMWQGLVELADGKPEAAIGPLDRAAQLDPKDIDILYHRGRAHLLVSKDSYEQMYAIDPDSWRVHQVLAQAYTESDRLMDAIAEYKRAIELAPSEPSLHEGLGDAYRNSTKLDQAEQAYADELKLDPQNLMAMFYLGEIRVERGNPGDARSLLETVVRENPSLIEARYFLGRSLAETGQSKDAEAQFKAVIEAHPDGQVEQRTYYQLVRLYRALNRPEDANAALKEFTRLKQESDAREASSLEERKKAFAKRQAEQSDADQQ